MKKLPTITIRGNEYVLVSERVKYFNEHYPAGSIQTIIVSHPESTNIIVKATIYPDAKESRAFIAHSQATIGDGMVNKTAALENAETSAVGRALGFMGIGVIESIASADEMHKAGINGSIKFATEKQIDWMRGVASKITGYEHAEDLDAWIKDILTLAPQQVPISKVKAAIDKLDEAKAMMDADAKVIQEDLHLEDTDVTDQDLQDLKDGKLPY